MPASFPEGPVEQELTALVLQSHQQCTISKTNLIKKLSMCYELSGIQDI